MILPQELQGPLRVDGTVVARVKLDLTLYFRNLTVDGFTKALNEYVRVFPDAKKGLYKIAELQEWIPVRKPRLTMSGREAAAAGSPSPLLEPVRRRIESGRSFEFRLWDGVRIDDDQESWSFSSHGILFRGSGRKSYIRYLLPVDAAPSVLTGIARNLADSIPFDFMHGGLSFAYYPWEKETAFDKIFALSRRFWGIDIEDIAGTLGSDEWRLKTVGWITGLGTPWLEKIGPRGRIPALQGVQAEQCRYGTVFVIGDAPSIGDVNRPGSIPEPYFQLADALKEVLAREHPDFDGSKFGKDDNTGRWLRRFVEPAEWR